MPLVLGLLCLKSVATVEKKLMWVDRYGLPLFMIKSGWSLL
jgi:hypothetical protein